jgi:hypothetical protein
MKLTSIFRVRKHRRHRIKFDRQGKSLRKRCFEAFDQGGRPAAVATALKMKRSTAFRYFTSWKRVGPRFEKRYLFVRNALKNDSGLREDILKQISRNLEISRDEVLRRLQQPWGLRQLLTQKFPLFFSPEEESEGEYRLRLGLTVADLFKGRDEHYADFYADLEQFLGNRMSTVQAPEGKEGEEINDYESETTPGERPQSPARMPFDPRNLTPEQRSELELYFAKKSAEEDVNTFVGLINLMEVMGLSREQAVEAFFQALLKVHGPEETKELWSALSKNMEIYLRTHHQDQAHQQ